jgi:hypothetical protein
MFSNELQETNVHKVLVPIRTELRMTVVVPRGTEFDQIEAGVQEKKRTNFVCILCDCLVESE